MVNKTLLIGCPVANREWIIKLYLANIMASVDAFADRERLDTHFIFLAREEDGTIPSLVVDHPEIANNITVLTAHDDTPALKEHAWKHQDFKRMVSLRNRLLVGVRERQPDLFLSLDSDILLAPPTISQLLETIQDYDAVGGKCYMTSPKRDMKEHYSELISQRHCPSYANFTRNGVMRRSDSSAVMQVGVIMAIKLMTPAAYNIDYMWDHRGEDVGWSRNCTQAGLKLGWDGRTINKHVIKRGELELVDPRVGF